MDGAADWNVCVAIAVMVGVAILWTVMFVRQIREANDSVKRSFCASCGKRVTRWWEDDPELRLVHWIFIALVIVANVLIAVKVESPGWPFGEGK